MRFILLAPLFIVAACAIETGDAGDEDLKTTTSNVTASCTSSRAQILASVSGARRRAITRGLRWLDEDVAYDQGGSFEGYRTDCSGFVSMCWETGTSFNTAAFAAGDGRSGKLASYEALLPGDALVRRSGTKGHIVLFLGWNDAKHTGACVLEQASTASDMKLGVRSTTSLKSSGFKAIRADKLDGSGVVAGGAAVEEPDETDDDAAGASCASDGACNPGGDGAGKICVGGRCASGCRSSAQCPGSTTCVAGQCR